MNTPAFEIQGVGAFTKNDELDWLYSEPMAIPVLSGAECCLVLEHYEEDEQKKDFHEAIRRFLSLEPPALAAAESSIWDYYQDAVSRAAAFGQSEIAIASPADLWNHIQLGDEPLFTRRGYGDFGVYVSLECDCDWEPEHGLQIVFKGGLQVNKVGPFDGHVTNSDAYADPSLEDVLYVSPNSR